MTHGKLEKGLTFATVMAVVHCVCQRSHSPTETCRGTTQRRATLFMIECGVERVLYPKSSVSLPAMLHLLAGMCVDLPNERAS